MTHQENNTTPSADFQEGWKLGQQAMLDTVKAHMSELFCPDCMSDGSIPNSTPAVTSVSEIAK